MKKVLDTMTVIIIVVVALSILMQLVRPYVPWLVAAAIVVFAFERLHRHFQNW